MSAKLKLSVFEETAAAAAKRFGVSVKALRIYERAGLIKPPRTAAGWRVYRQAELERLSAILALKQLGLPLKRIALLFKGGGDLAAALELQEAALLKSRNEAEEALRLVRQARQRLGQRRSLSPDDLGNLVRRTAMVDSKWTPEMEALAQKHFSPQQLQELRARPFTAEDQARVSAAWEQVFDDVEALGPNADPTSDKALEIGRRAHALVNEFTRGDPALSRAAAGMNVERMQTPNTPPSRMDGAMWGFLGKTFAELKRRGVISG